MTWQLEGIMPVAHELIIAGLSDSVIVLDAQNRILELNPSAQELVGYRASDVVGKPVAQIWADWPDQMEHPCVEAEISQEIVLGERDAQHTYDVRCSAIVDAQGQVVGRVVVLRDISDHKRATEMLQRAQKYLKQRDWQLAQILATGKSLRLSLNLDSLLYEIVQGVRNSLDFGAVVLNLIDPQSGHLRVRACVGLNDEARQVLEDAAYPWEDVAGLMQEQFRIGHTYFIPHGEYDWDRNFRGPTYNVVSTEANGSAGNNNNWHPDDALFVPIELRQGQIVGVISLDQPLDGRRPSQERLQALEIYANLAAVAIENAQLYTQVQQELAKRAQAEEALRNLNVELESRVLERTSELTKANTELVREVNERKQAEAELLKRNRELLSLQAAAVATTSSLDLHFVLETVTWEMAGMLGVEGCAIYEWDQEANTLAVITEYGSTSWVEEGSPAIVYHLADYPAKKQVLAERCALQTTDSSTQVDAAQLADMQKADVKSLLMLPMVFQDRVVGLVEMKDRRADRTFTDHEISLAQLLANQTASAVENARLYERAQREITERMRAEEQIKLSLQEKEVLLKEIHHRVKNNLQVISSLLSLQSKGIEDQSSLELFRESRDRIRSMALIHEKLYRSRDLARVDFSEYIRSLAAYLVRSYRASSGPVALKVNADDVLLGIDTAVPCGLIINELISNSLKHAFPPNGDKPAGVDPMVNGPDIKEGEIRVELCSDQDHQLTLIVGDNGVGFPEGLDFRETESLGMQLVNTLVGQLDGTVELYCNGGTQFKITFPMR